MKMEEENSTEKGKEKKGEAESKGKGVKEIERNEGKGFRSLVPRPFMLMNGLIRGYEFKENRREKKERGRGREGEREVYAGGRSG